MKMVNKMLLDTLENIHQQRFQAAIKAFDQANAEDPNTETFEGKAYPKELLYAMHMTQMQEIYAPEATETLKLAVRAQHIQRWKSPRSDFAMGKQGYLQWRTNLYHFHADTAGKLMESVGYDDTTIKCVQANIGKKGLKINPETQLTEDIAILVFIQHYMLAFSASHPEYDEEKWVKIIKKTWQKMSSRAHEFVLAGKIKVPEALKPLILKTIKAN